MNNKIISWNWKNYMEKLNRSGKVEEAIRTIEEARKIWANYESFEKMPISERRLIGGFSNKEDCWNYRHPTIDVGFFGSMEGDGYFKKIVKQNNINISKGLDCIPKVGVVTKQNFDEFIQYFEKAKAEVQQKKHYSLGKNIAGPTRLLTMKRPDWFFCLNRENNIILEEFGIYTQQVIIDDYWNKIIIPIQRSEWYNAEIPSNDKEQIVHRNRVALLDRIYDS